MNWRLYPAIYTVKSNNFLIKMQSILCRKLVIGFVAALPCLSVADEVTTQLAGTFNRSQENGCVLVSIFYFGVDCSYSGHRDGPRGREKLWVGPTVNAVYYPVGSAEAAPKYVPVANDARVAPALVGTVTLHNIDDQPESVTVTGTFTVGPVARSVVTRTARDKGLVRAVESWQSLVHVLSDTPVDSATANDLGGYDYVIASLGFPERLCLVDDQDDCFPAAGASIITDGKWGADLWPGAAEIPIGRAGNMGGNVGAVTSASIIGYQCSDESNGRECRGGVNLWGDAEGPGFDNLLLWIATDKNERIVELKGFWSHEYSIGVGPLEFRPPSGEDDSWEAGYMELYPVAEAPNQ